MAHELEILQNGEASTFYVGDVPWHKLGKRLIKAPTVEEGIVAAGLNWTVGLRDLVMAADGREVDHKATVRESDGSILGVVGPGYKPLQNLEAFNFFNPFLAAGEASLETAGALFNGKRVWILAKINRDPSVIVKGDAVEKYILLSNSHDGTLAVRVGFTPVRVVCNNTLSMATGTDARLIRVRHTGSVAENLAKVGEIMNLANAQFEATAEQYRELARNQISAADLERLVKVTFTPAKADDEDAAKRILENVIPLFESGRGNDMPGVAGTYWGAYNAITEYLQYERGKDEQSRLNQLWFGQSATMSKRALETALDMIKAA